MTVKFLEKKVDNLIREVVSLQAMVREASIPVDNEGEYRPEFVKEILAISRKKGKGTSFTTKEAFLRELNKFKKK